jgi:hypothetical protein
MYVQPPSLLDSAKINHHLRLVLMAVLQFLENNHQVIMIQLKFILAFIGGGAFFIIIMSTNAVKRGKETKVSPRVGPLTHFPPVQGSREHPMLQWVPLVDIHASLVSVQVQGQKQVIVLVKIFPQCIGSPLLRHGLREIRGILQLEWLEAFILIKIDAQVVCMIELAALEQIMEHVLERISEKPPVCQPWWFWVWVSVPSSSCH